MVKDTAVGLTGKVAKRTAGLGVRIVDDPLALVGELNPLALLLGPIQDSIGKFLMPARTINRLLTWRNRAATLWLYLGCIALSIVLVLIPWVAVFRLLVRACVSIRRRLWSMPRPAFSPCLLALR